MRHNKKFNHLGRTASHRNAMMSNMCTSLIMHKRIFTTLAKAKALRKVVEPIITKSKEDTTHSRRLVFQVLQSKSAVTELFQNVSQKVADRPGGYTRIIKTGSRLGDNAAMCFIELVDFNENMQKEQKSAAKTRTRRSKKATAATETVEATVDEKAPAKKAKAETDATKKAPTAKKAQPKATATAKPKAESKPKTEAKKETKKDEE